MGFASLQSNLSVAKQEGSNLITSKYWELINFIDAQVHWTSAADSVIFGIHLSFLLYIQVFTSLWTGWSLFLGQWSLPMTLGICVEYVSRK